MIISEARIVNVLHSRGFAVVMALLMVAGAWWTYDAAGVNYIIGDRGLLFRSANQWISDPTAAMAVSCALTLAGALLMLLLNKTFNLTRSVTSLDATLFIAMSLSVPDLLCQMYTGPVLMAVMLMCLFLLYNSYGDRNATRNIFVIFMLLSAGTMTQYCFVAYMPVFYLGMGQMRIFTVRTVVASVLGLVTPWWIVFGLGLADVSQLHVPEVQMAFVAFSEADTIHLFGTIALASVMLIVGWFMNFMKMISYNAHMRAYTGTLSVMGLATLLALCVDYASICVYTPVLFMLTSLQLCHTFANRPRTHTSVPLAAIILIYIFLFVWRVAL